MTLDTVETETPDRRAISLIFICEFSFICAEMEEERGDTGKLYLLPKRNTRGSADLRILCKSYNIGGGGSK